MSSQKRSHPLRFLASPLLIRTPRKEARRHMAGKMTMTIADLQRLSPSAMAQISQQMEEQGSSIPQPRMRRGGHGHGHIPKVKLTRNVYIGFATYFALMGMIALALLATFPGH